MTWLAILPSKQNSAYEFLRGRRHLEEVCVCCQHSHCSNLQRPPLLPGGIQLMPLGPVLTVHMDTLPAPPGRNCVTPSTCEQPQGDLRVAMPSRCPARPGRRQSPHQPGGSQGLAVTEASQGVRGRECIKQHKGPRRPSISSETPNHMHGSSVCGRPLSPAAGTAFASGTSMGLKCNISCQFHSLGLLKILSPNSARQ